MTARIAYDITRLVTRMFNVTPNGIDRIDFAFAEHVLAKPEACGAVWVPPWGPRLMPGAAARAAVAGIGIHWGEDKTPAEDPAYRQILLQLTGGSASSAVAAPRVQEGRAGQAFGTLEWLRAYGLPLVQRPAKHLPQGARYLNASQFPLWIASYFEWLEHRPDVKAVFFIHDLLPLEMPEYFPDAEFERHRQRLVNLARFGAGVITTTQTVKEALSAHLKPLGRADMPILVAPFPMSPLFRGRRDGDPALRDIPYFVVCGTLEPRKNHLMLLQVWRALVQRHGADAPRLVFVGNRGWKFGPVIDLLDRCPALRGYVVEANGLTTPGLRRLLDGARALLMPSFGEGYGLPVHEALAAGVPVIASDIPVFREIVHPALTRLSPLNGEAWLEEVRARTAVRRAALTGEAPVSPSGLERSAYFDNVDEFVGSL